MITGEHFFLGGISRFPEEEYIPYPRDKFGTSILYNSWFRGLQLVGFDGNMIKSGETSPRLRYTKFQLLFVEFLIYVQVIYGVQLHFVFIYISTVYLTMEVLSHWKLFRLHIAASHSGGVGPLISTTKKD